MSPEELDKPVRDLVTKHFLPADLCPSAPEAIEAMLDAAAGKPLENEQIERMLKKARGELPVGEGDDDTDWSEGEESEREEELLALHRNEGGKLPPEVEERLRQLREQAKRKPKEDDGGDELETGTGLS